MPGNKTMPTALDVGGFIDGLPSETRRADANAIMRLMKSATGENPRMWGPSIIGFGSYHYAYESGREGDMPLACFSPRKNAIVLYGLTGFTGSDELLSRLGQHTMGKGCIYIKNLAAIDPGTLEELVGRSVAVKRKI